MEFCQEFAGAWSTKGVKMAGTCDPGPDLDLVLFLSAVEICHWNREKGDCFYVCHNHNTPISLKNPLYYEMSL